jgi:hypothetical protein
MFGAVAVVAVKQEEAANMEAELVVVLLILLHFLSLTFQPLL